MDLDFLDGFDTDLDWGFTTTDSKPSETKDTEAVAKTAASEVAKVTDGSLKALESKLDKIYSAVNSAKSELLHHPSFCFSTFRLFSSKIAIDNLGVRISKMLFEFQTNQCVLYTGS